jgi:hypothetical protein
MLSLSEYITISLDTNLFFLRIMKEHAFFLEIAFMQKEDRCIDKAKYFRESYESLLSEAADMAPGRVSRKAVKSEQFVTCHTMEAEEVTSCFTCIPFNMSITRKELSLSPNDRRRPLSEQAVTSLNKRAYKLTLEFIEFKEMLLNRVLDCSMFMATYPLLIDHITKEARLFAKRLDTLLRGMHFRDLLGQEIFWNERMEEHMEFVAGLLDPTEEPLICDARNLAKLFDNLNKKVCKESRPNINSFTKESLDATKKVKQFKNTATNLVLDCKLRSMIMPLLADHILREANHYLFILGAFNS